MRNIIILVLLLSASYSNALEPNSLRLIETTPGGQTWMTRDEIMKLSRSTHEHGHCGGFMDVTEHAAAAPVYLRPFSTLENRAPKQQAIVDPLLEELSAKNLLNNVTKLAGYKNRYYESETGVAAAQWIQERFSSHANSRSDITVELYKHSFKQPSVIATIKGSGSRANEHVILGAHEDSINWSSFFPSPNDPAPGADDDASGVATILEVFRVLAQSSFRPNRTIKFVTYAGEEVGLRGSQDLAENHKSRGIQVAGVLQLDMTMYPGSGRTMRFVSDYVDNDLTKFTQMIVDEYVKVPWKEEPCGYACSDHASWNKAGYPAVFPFEAMENDYNPKIHSKDDTIANNLDADFGLHFAKTGLAFAVELGAE